MCTRRSFLYSSAAVAGLGLVDARGFQIHSHNKAQAAAAIADSANRFLTALDPNQRAKAMLPFDSDERMNWHFVPRERKGLSLREMTAEQKQLAGALLAAGLSRKGYIKASTIMSLEDVLRVLENDTGGRRDPEKYYFSIFGTPSVDGTWGYRVEGHHLSQNYTIANGEVVDAPSFFGANPAEVRQGPRKGLRTLAGEEDLGFALLQSLNDHQRKVALVATSTYGDILTGSDRTAALTGQPSGVSAGNMTRRQFDALMALMEDYAHNVPDGLARSRMSQIQKAGKNIHFAWAGSLQRGAPHYYRVQTSSFLIEMDNTQNGGNHIHSVWRDFTGDFGQDLLRAHYQASHGGLGQLPHDERWQAG